MLVAQNFNLTVYERPQPEITLLVKVFQVFDTLADTKVRTVESDHGTPGGDIGETKIR